MKYLLFSTHDQTFLPAPVPAVEIKDWIVNLTAMRLWAKVHHAIEYETVPFSLQTLASVSDDEKAYLQNLIDFASEIDLESETIETLGGQAHPLAWKKADGKIHPPVRPVSIRDFYAFEQHVKTANENRGREVPKEWYQIPVFYFTNHTAIFGQDDVIPYPVGSEKLDYELEVAAVIGKTGHDIKPEEAEDYIFGYMIYNDWSARDIQAQEMRVGLGPAKGKDFAQSFGPYLVTPDELADKHTGRPGVYDLEMVARVNGKEMSRGNWKDLHYSFGEMIARASAGVTLYPGDVIGSGTVGTGCLLEITKGEGPYLQPDDVVELEIERLGILKNTVGKKQK